MKKISIIIVVLVITALSCNSISNSDKKIFDISYFINIYPHYKLDTLSFSPNVALCYSFDTLSMQEILLFTKEGLYFEYVFYNISTNEPRYTIYFDSILNVTMQEGKPIYLSSPNFSKNNSKDTFEVNIYTATPPEFKTYVRVYYIDTLGIENEVANNVVKDDGFTKFIGICKQDKKSRDDYFVVSRICFNNFERLDTVWFQIFKN